MGHELLSIEISSDNFCNLKACNCVAFHLKND